jgi:hypothetical protein
MKTMFGDILQFRQCILHTGSKVRSYSRDYYGEQIFPTLTPDRYICFPAFELIR